MNSPAVINPDSPVVSVNPKVIESQHPSVLLTIDVEDWFQVENFKSAIPLSSWDDLELRVEKNTHRLLDLFDDIRGTNRSYEEPKSRRAEEKTGTFSFPSTSDLLSLGSSRFCATFFVLGWIAKRLPNLVREIQNRGHEVASHGYHHHLCSDQNNKDLRKDLKDSKKLLEDIIGSPVHGYRAPSFSVSNDILEIIEDAGYRYDASYNSFDKHGRYGKLILNGHQKQGITYKISEDFFELPVSNLSLQCSTFNVQPVVVPWSGGGYFRLFPLRLFKMGVKKILKQDNAYHFYLHPWEIDPDQPRVNAISPIFKFRHYVNIDKTIGKLKALISSFSDCRFITLNQYIKGLKVVSKNTVPPKKRRDAEDGNDQF